MTTRKGAFKPEPFQGTFAPAGPSPEAVRKLGLNLEPDEVDGQEEEDDVPTTPPSHKKSSRARAPTRSPAVPPARVERAPAAPARGRPAKDDRVQRSIRLTMPVDAKLRELAEARGIDINAAVSVAIAEDWRRSFGPYQGRT